MIARSNSERGDGRPVRTISISKASTIQQCSLKYRLRYVEKAREESRGAALVVGTVIDLAVKAIVLRVQAGDLTVGKIDADAIFDPIWAEEEDGTSMPILWGAKGRDTVRETALGVLGAFCQLPDLQERIDSIVAADVRFEMPLRDPILDIEVPGVVVVGVLDFVQRVPDGRVRMLEIKTAANKSYWKPENLPQNTQAAVYQVALRDLYGAADVALDAWWWIGLKLKKSEWIDRTAEISKESESRAMLMLRHAVHAASLGMAYPQPNMMCPGCSYSRQCQAWHASELAVLPVDPFVADAMLAPAACSSR